LGKIEASDGMWSIVFKKYRKRGDNKKNSEKISDLEVET
jgi:hypothetical protein